MKLELVADEVELPWHPAPDWQRPLEALLSRVGPADGILQVVLSDDATLREHNRDFRGKDQPTDVLSFSYLESHEASRTKLLAGDSAREYCPGPLLPGEDLLIGQLLLSLETLERRGPVHTGDRDREAHFFVVHGLLHVLGYDHLDEESASEMEKEEQRLMQWLVESL